MLFRLLLPAILESPGQIMARFFALEPEVAGGWGDDTEVDVTVHPPVVKSLHYAFNGWLGDELLESFPIFLVSEALGHAMNVASLTGFVLAPVKVSLTEEYLEMQPEVELPPFVWLQVTGVAGESDIGLSPKHLLVASERAMDVLRAHAVNHCTVAAWQ